MFFLGFLTLKSFSRLRDNIYTLLHSPLPLEEGVCNALILVDVQTKVSQRHLRSFRGVVGPGFAQ